MSENENINRRTKTLSSKGKSAGPSADREAAAWFSTPAIIQMLVNSIYNIVDQIFIGQGVGYLGNAATTVVFPV
jgi:Na+-driven multidrug efflux pump